MPQYFMHTTNDLCFLHHLLVLPIVTPVASIEPETY